MLAKKKASKVATTESNHPHYKYPNKVKDLKPLKINELWPVRPLGLRAGKILRFSSLPALKPKGRTGPQQMHQRSENPSFAGIRTRKYGTKMCNTRPFSDDFNICPTQSVAYAPV